VKSTTAAPQFEFRILGPLEVVKDGRSLSLGGKLLRALVVALLLKGRAVCTADELIDALWATSAPRSARASLHNMLSGLRRAFGPGMLVTTPSGYLLAAADDAVDVARFERLLERAHAADVSAKIRLLDQALALWRGTPLVDVRYEEFAQGEIRRLEELHIIALEEHLAAKVELGNPEAVVPELQRLVDAFPFRERLRMQLMDALHRSGRSVEALSTYVEWRRILTDSWDIEPGPAIRQLWDDIRLQTADRYLAAAH
jgi:DNA-binding SARP family transcriptional activator